ncbi:MAG: alpha-L-rhamnosidase N-terminal domain-containing protein [Bacteroidales bacterium]|nr:alpha-L-rhamnosidase N-terminal domain-containing protein [Bacteroidales bacterium]
MRNFLLWAGRAVFCLAVLAGTGRPVYGQLYVAGAQVQDMSPQLLRGGEWPAQWIAAPDEVSGTYGVYHFRKTWELDTVPAHFVVHVSADNGYKLYINGHQVSVGPARGDLNNWNFHTVDLAPYLAAGKNVAAAVVWNLAGDKAMAQISRGSAEFLVQGDDEASKVLNTDASWRCLRNTAYTPWTRWSVSGYYVAGACDALDARSYPWGWEQPGYDDAAWQNARTRRRAAMRGAKDYYGHWLIPAGIPEMEMTPQRFAAIRQVENAVVTAPAMEAAAAGRTGRKRREPLPETLSIAVPAHTEARVLLDQGVLTTGYLRLLFSGGRDAVVTAGYAESLMGGGMFGGSKGNRNEVENKRFSGYADRITADGGANREFMPLWWRTWRYVELRITTADEPLTIDDVSSVFSAYPFKLASTFSTPDAKYGYLDNYLAIGWRTARLCAHDTYMDCPYYEQLQYFGDTRIQTMVTMYNTADTCMVRHALELGRQSLTPEGITMSRYPSADPQYIPSYALSWIGILHDYWMMRDDAGYVRTALPAVHSILDWFMQWLKPDYSMGYVPFWYFADWAGGFGRGEPPREADGRSAYQDLELVMALDAAAEMEQALGVPAMAGYYQATADSMRRRVRVRYWDAGRGLFADTDTRRSFSQHVNTLAVLTGTVSGEEATELMRKVLSDKTLTQCTIYYRYYLQQAMDKAGLGSELLEHLDVLHALAASGLTTWAETADPARSDCHAWGASLNVELFRTLLGIRPAMAGFREVLIQPSLSADMTAVSGSVPHPQGTVSASYKVSGRSVRADIELPEKVGGTLVWQGRSYALHGGAQTLTLPRP